MTLLSTGTAVKGDAAADGTVWSVKARDVRDLAMVAGAGMTATTGNQDGVEIACYSFSDSVWGDAALAAAKASIGAYDKAYGKYPSDKLTIVQANLDSTGMTYPDLILINRTLAANPDPDGGMSIVIAHEIAHQWFYGLVGNDQYEEPWLDESLTSYSELLYMGTYLSKEEIATRVQTIENGLQSDGSLTDAASYRLDRAYGAFANDYLYTAITYKAGEVFLYRLREAIGDDAFTAALNDYIGKYSHSFATTADFVTCFTPATEGNAAAKELLSRYLGIA